MKRLCFIGGDKRQIRVINRLCELFPQIKIFGFDKAENSFSDKVIICETMAEAVRDSEIIVCPLPYSADGENIYMPYSENLIRIEEVLKITDKTQILLLGKADDTLKNLLDKYKIKCVDYLEREELAILNAIPTAEGAIEIAMHETPHTINGSECLVLGNGRIGKVLSKMLTGIGANVTVCVRKHKDIAYCQAMGYKNILFKELANKVGSYNVIFNTVPLRVIGANELGNMRKDCIIIDLASNPGGVDFEEAKKSAIKTIHALSLPGKVAPKTAGDYVAETIKNIIEEMEV